MSLKGLYMPSISHSTHHHNTHIQKASILAFSSTTECASLHLYVYILLMCIGVCSALEKRASMDTFWICIQIWTFTVWHRRCAQTPRGFAYMPGLCFCSFWNEDYHRNLIDKNDRRAGMTHIHIKRFSRVCRAPEDHRMERCCSAIPEKLI